MPQAHSAYALLIGGIVGSLLLAWPHQASSQATAAPAFTSRSLQMSSVSGDEGKQIILMAVSIQPGASVPPHTHPGDCVGTLVEGTVELMAQGKDPRRLAPGDSYVNPRGTIHWFRNVGDGPAKLLNTLIVDKAAPPVQPASANAR